MNLVYGRCGGDGVAEWDATLRAELQSAYGLTPAILVEGPDPGMQRLGVLSDGGAVIGRARQGEIALACIGAVTLPLAGWSGPAAPIDDPDATAAFLLQRYVASGKAFLKDVHGQFAVAVIDVREQLALLAADPGGGRSWYVHETAGGLSFSSNLYCLAKGLGRDLAIDRSLEDFFLIHGFYPFGRTPYVGIRALAPGNVLEWRNGRSQVEASPAQADPWKGDAETAGALRTEADVVDGLYAAMMRATEDQLPSRRQRVAVLLGGFDSALVAAMIKRLGFEVETYSFHYADASFNQPHTDTLARYLGIRHNWVEIDRPLIERGLREFAKSFNQPTNWPNYVIQTAHSCALIREAGIRHCYSGDGCDSVFLGYPGTYRRARLFHALPRLPGWLGRALLAAAGRPSLERMLGHPYRVGLSLLRGLGRPMPARGYLSFRILDEVSLRQLRRGAPPAAESSLEALADRLSEPHAGLPPLRLAYLGKAAVSPNRNKMIGSADASGVTLLAPYLHAGLKNYALRMPEEWMRPRTGPGARAQGKYILMRMAEVKGLLPPSVITQPKVAAVDAPIDEWYAGPLRPMMLETLRDLPFDADASYLGRLLDRKASETLFKRYVMVDKVVSHAASLLATYASFASLAKR